MRCWTPLLRVTRTGILKRPVMTGNRRRNRSSSTGSAVQSCFHSSTSSGAQLTRRRRWQPVTTTEATNTDQKRSFSTDHGRLQVITAASGCALHGRPQEGQKIGHDSYFVAKTEKFTALGVADGVTQWLNHRIDPADFSFSLMENCRRSAVRGESSPLSILKEGYAVVRAVRPRLIGSSTACVAVIEGQTLMTANLGDSGFVVIRESSVAHASSPQQHFPSCPYQLSILPRTKEHKTFVHDSPKMADLTSFKLEPQDVIVLGTDGLFENLAQEQIIDNIATLKDINQESVTALVKSMVDESRGLAYEIDEMTPFAREAARLYFGKYKGGKPDDITAVIAAVVDSHCTK